MTSNVGNPSSMLSRLIFSFVLACLFSVFEFSVWEKDYLKWLADNRPYLLRNHGGFSIGPERHVELATGTLSMNLQKLKMQMCDMKMGMNIADLKLEVADENKGIGKKKNGVWNW
ncbi:hypothetical protein GQ55_3G298300 [Panicum hallii var. hallii]|uniref:Uncharacterized protein n=1 Tax=Panicum hallii var. hallii TaxID=1504633 RepID=A0A2T7EES5_9POAL|nr:hypothetical protein GQ55_3G298300 [Panicum hallii var. hallii]